MICIKCNATETRVIDTYSKRPSYVRRRRECAECGTRFTTRETHYFARRKMPLSKYREVLKKLLDMLEDRG